ncbi:MAG: hypothetical protein ACOYWZ_02370 [Bacillota bacterium]
MKFKLFLDSLFYFRNIGVLLILTGLIYSMTISGYYPAPLFYAAALAAYFAFVMQSLTSKKFQDKFLHKMKEKRIRELNRLCFSLAEDAKKHTNSAYYKKLCSIMEDRQEIVNSYSKDRPNFLKEKITEQTLGLVVSYIKLLKNFCIRSRELSFVNVNPVLERISQNNRKLNFINDPKIYEDLKKIIEMDERIITRLKEEKQELERIDAKLDYIKSTVSMFKHQINSSLESQEMLEKIESVVNEAMALETVLEERHKKRIRN